MNLLPQFKNMKKVHLINSYIKGIHSKTFSSMMDEIIFINNTILDGYTEGFSSDVSNLVTYLPIFTYQIY